ncbi:holin [Streptomyces chryseus]|uniref:holin n=1 Tax=Streptomyces chryseus TaxID=68186 RepID=UPI00110F800A|nr:holin [Streptomyces chryseus]GGX01827.1 hypothetical protein GCM10010353_16790 [Streptomyces chryseus]
MANHEPVETKVKAASIASYLGFTGLLAILVTVQDDAGIVAGLPDVIEPFVLSLIPAAITFASGWKAKHTPRRGPTVAP